VAEQNPLGWLGEELHAGLRSPGQHVVLFGSAVMLLHGLREEIGDVDLFITTEGAARLAVTRPDRWRHRFVRPDDPPLLEWTGGPVVVHAFERWTSRDWWINVRQAWNCREMVQGWPCVSLEMVSRWKREAARWNPGSPAHEKHLVDADRIDAYLEGQHAA
jgi:hypothetical protein